MKLLYGTTNEGKLQLMRRYLSRLPEVELIGLQDLEKSPPVLEECGQTPLENARIKAWAYYQFFQMPIFSCDSGLYFEGLKESLQPGVHVRRVGGKELSDEEMTDYYAGLARTYGDLTARYKNAVCLVLDQTHSYESMDDALSGEPFLLTSVPHPRRQKGFPLDCLSKKIANGAYYYDLGGTCQDDVALDDGFLTFFQNSLQKYLQII